MRKPLLLLLLWLVNVGVRAEEHHARPLSPQLVDARAQASQLFAELDAQDQYRQSLTYDDLMVLPVGLKRNIGNSTVELAISKAIFKADRAELTVYIRLRMPAPSSNGGAAERTLFFGADQIGLTRNGGLSGQFRALLLGDFALPFEQLTVVFKGGNGLAPNGQVSDDLAQTYAVFNCQTGFERAKLSADVLFSQKMLVPLNPLTFSVDANRPVVGSFSIETSAGLHDIIGTMNFNSPFAIKGFEKLGFIVQNVVFDFSDLTNAPTLSPAAFPVGYVARNAPPGDVAYKTWRGIYAQNVALVLPAEFKRKGTTGRKIAVGASNLLIDQNGVSGRFQVTNAIALDSGRADNWRMSLTQFAVDIQENQLVGGQLAGRLQLPITNPNDSSQALAFAGRIERGGNYQLAVAAVSNLQFDLWKAKANLLAGSYVELKVVNGAFLPKAVLSGSLGISTTPSGTADTLNSKNLVRFAGVSFQNLTIQSVSPRLSADYFGYQGNCRYLGLPLVVERAGVSFGRGPLGRGSSDTAAYDKATLYFAASINLMREAVSAKTAVRIASYFDPQTETWRFERIFVDELGISAQTANFTIAGRVSQFSNRPIYGSGFEGQVSLTVKGLKSSITASALGLFGKTDDSLNVEGFRYWYVEALASGFSIPVAGPLAITAIGGTVYHNLRPQAATTQVNVSNGPVGGINYLPDANVAFGFKAAVGIGLSSPAAGKLLTGKLGLEMVYSKDRGLNSIGFFGEAQLSAALTDLIDSTAIKGTFKTLVSRADAAFATDANSGKAFSQERLQKKAERELPPLNLSQLSGKFYLRAALLFDFRNGQIHGQAEAFLNVANGVVSGVGPGGRVGWVVAHFDDKEWYVHAGSPTDRLGLRAGLGPVQAQLRAYFMLGHRIPAFPPPPPHVQRLLGISQTPTTRQSTELLGGRGIAFGADLSLSTGDFQFLIFYARFEVGGGFDLMLQDYGSTCPQLGINGWYAKGQAYAYVQGDVGMRVRLFGFKKSISVFNGGAAVLLQAEFPNPSYLAGTVAGRYEVLGGLLKGNFKVDMKVGNKNSCGL